jgi:hypothetical protein
MAVGMTEPALRDVIFCQHVFWVQILGIYNITHSQTAPMAKESECDLPQSKVGDYLIMLTNKPLSAKQR